MTNVYFATNRSSTPAGGFGSGIVAPADTCCAVTEVANIDLDQENSGDLAAITMRQTGGFAHTVQAEILAAGRNLLVFIHGFDNSFEDAIKRSAFNREWFAAAQRQATDTKVVSFTRPSEGRLFADHPTLLDDAYKTDQSMSGASGPHIAAFLRHALDLGRRLKEQEAGAHVILLTHSIATTRCRPRWRISSPTGRRPRCSTRPSWRPPTRLPPRSNSPTTRACSAFASWHGESRSITATVTSRWRRA
jgi:esterase/lipase superfamily enzyme